MEAIKDLSDISDSESFEESKYEHQSSKKHKRKHSKKQRTREEKRISISDDSDLEPRIVGTFTECNPVVYQEEYYNKSSSEKRSSRHKSRKHHKRDRDLPARDHSASSISSNDSNENHYRKKNSHHRRRHKDSDKEDIVHKRHRSSDYIKDEDEENSHHRMSYSEEEEVERGNYRSSGSRSKRHKSRHKHSSRHRHRRRTSAERHARRLVRKRRRRSRSLASSGSSAAEERLRSRQVVKTELASVGDNMQSDATSAVVREPDASQWDEAASSNIRSRPREEAAAAPVKSEPPSGSESDERPLQPTSSAPTGGNRQRDERRDREDMGAPRPNRENEGRVANRNGSQQNGREVWGVAEPPKEEKEPEEKVKPNLGLSGKLTEDANTYKGVVIKYSQPSEARKPKRRWRWYIFKGDEELPFLPLHRQSAYLIGRERRVVDVPTDHPSCSKQHAVLQYRLVRYTRDDGTVGRTVKPYIIDLESANGTYVNNRRITSRSYVELLEKDVVKFGYSSREYVLLHETSKDSDADTADAGLDMSPVSALMSTAMTGQ